MGLYNNFHILMSHSTICKTNTTIHILFKSITTEMLVKNYIFLQFARIILLLPSNVLISINDNVLGKFQGYEDKTIKK